MMGCKHRRCLSPHDRAVTNSGLLLSYNVATFSWRLVEDQRYRCTVELKRVKGGQGLLDEDVLKHPTPSELDQFELFWEHVRVIMQAKLGGERYKIWLENSPDEQKMKARHLRYSTKM